MAVSRLVPDPNAPAAAGYAAPGSSAPDMAPATPAALGDRFWQGIVAGTETGDAAASTTTTYTLQIGQSFYGTMGSQDDGDWIAVQLVAGQSYDIRLLGQGRNFLSDPSLLIFDSSGQTLQVLLPLKMEDFPEQSGADDDQFAALSILPVVVTMHSGTIEALMMQIERVVRITNNNANALYAAKYAGSVLWNVLQGKSLHQA